MIDRPIFLESLIKISELRIIEMGDLDFCDTCKLSIDACRWVCMPQSIKSSVFYIIHRATATLDDEDLDVHQQRWNLRMLMDMHATKHLKSYQYTVNRDVGWWRLGCPWSGRWNLCMLICVRQLMSCHNLMCWMTMTFNRYVPMLVDELARYKIPHAVSALDNTNCTALMLDDADFHVIQQGMKFMHAKFDELMDLFIRQ